MDEHPTARPDPMAWTAPSATREPQPTYRQLLDWGPVLPSGSDGVVVVGRHEVEEVLRHPELYSSALTIGDLSADRPLIPLQIDPPDQKKYRKLLDPLFAPHQVKGLEPSITALAHELIDGFAHQDEVDLVSRFSVPFPSQVFLTTLGLPLGDLGALLELKEGIIRPHVVVGKPLRHPEVTRYQEQTARRIYAYFEAHIDDRGAERRDDVLSHLLAAEVDGDRLSREDVLDVCFLLLIAGLDTVAASLECFFVHLAEHPDLRRRIVDEPSTISSVVEELLRWETPVMLVPRVATRDAVLGGCPIRSGTTVLALLGAANLDGDASASPGVSVDRDVNRHLAFGGGIHRCLGSHLARVELRVALEVWHQRIPEYSLAHDAELTFSFGVRAAESVRLVLGPTARKVRRDG
jgi:cytochrome P450